MLRVLNCEANEPKHRFVHSWVQDDQRVHQGSWIHILVESRFFRLVKLIRRVNGGHKNKIFECFPICFRSEVAARNIVSKGDVECATTSQEVGVAHYRVGIVLHLDYRDVGSAFEPLVEASARLSRSLASPPAHRRERASHVHWTCSSTLHSLMKPSKNKRKILFEFLSRFFSRKIEITPPLHNH